MSDRCECIGGANQHAPTDFRANLAMAMSSVASLLLDWVDDNPQP